MEKNAWNKRIFLSDMPDVLLRERRRPSTPREGEAAGPKPSGSLILLVIFLLISTLAYAETIKLMASWYSLASLKAEGTYKYSKGVMANGKVFKEEALTCATRLWPLGSTLRVTNTSTGEHVEVQVTDRIGKRFAKTRIDLSKAAFQKIAGPLGLKQGLIPCEIEIIK